MTGLHRKQQTRGQGENPVGPVFQVRHQRWVLHKSPKIDEKIYVFLKCTAFRICTGISLQNIFVSLYCLTIRNDNHNATCTLCITQLTGLD